MKVLVRYTYTFVKEDQVHTDTENDSVVLVGRLTRTSLLQAFRKHLWKRRAYLIKNDGISISKEGKKVPRKYLTNGKILWFMPEDEHTFFNIQKGTTDALYHMRQN